MTSNRRRTTTTTKTIDNKNILDYGICINHHRTGRRLIRRSIKNWSIIVVIVAMAIMMMPSMMNKRVLGLSQPSLLLLRNYSGRTTTKTTRESSSSSSSSSSLYFSRSNNVVDDITVDVIVTEHIWRKAAMDHSIQIRNLLQPGLTPKHHHLNSGSYRQQRGSHSRSKDRHDDSDDETIRDDTDLAQRRRPIKPQQKNEITVDTDEKAGAHNNWVSAMDPEHPIYNFLIEYYGLKGTKGVRRLVRWAPCPGLLLLPQSTGINHHHQQQQPNQQQQQDDGRITIIDSMDELMTASKLYLDPTTMMGDRQSSSARKRRRGGILLEGATEDDFASTLHLRGAYILKHNDHPSGISGVVYSPTHFFQSQLEQLINFDSSGEGGADIGTSSTSITVMRSAAARLVSPFLWYQSILTNTLQAEPVLHCYGLHEWSMLYRPAGAPPPPSGKYQKHLPLRVSQAVLNETVERKGVSCTHIDALRFFTKEALRFNRYGGDPTTRPLDRSDQRRLEQPACVHAHMDLLKMVLKLQPFCDSELLLRVLSVALEARKLDVSASPYDATRYGVGVVPIETTEGRVEYKLQQTKLMKLVEPIRKDLLCAYNLLLFDLLPFNGTALDEGNRLLPATTTAMSSMNVVSSTLL